MHIFRARFVQLAFCFGIFFVSLGTKATTLPSWGPSEIFAKSDLVARVRIVSAQARWVQFEQSDKIVTFYEVEVLEILKGKTDDASSRLSIGLPGGVVGDIGQRVEAIPALKLGEEWVLHLGEAAGPGGARGVVAFSHGAHRVKDGRVERTRTDARRVSSPSLEIFREQCLRLNSRLHRGAK